MEGPNACCSICQVCSITYCVCNIMKTELSPVVKDIPTQPSKPCSICEVCSVTYCVCDKIKEKPSSPPEQDDKPSKEAPSEKPAEGDTKLCSVCNLCSGSCECKQAPKAAIVKEETEVKEPKLVADIPALGSTGERPCEKKCWGGCNCRNQQPQSVTESILAKVTPCNKCNLCWENCTCEETSQMPETTLPEKSEESEIPSPETTPETPETTPEAPETTPEAPETTPEAPETTAEIPVATVEPSEAPEIAGEFPEATETVEPSEATGEVIDTVVVTPVAQEVVPVDKQSGEIPQYAAEEGKKGPERATKEIMGKDTFSLSVIISLTIPPCNCGSKQKKPRGEVAPITEEPFTKQQVIKETPPPEALKEPVELPVVPVEAPREIMEETCIKPAEAKEEAFVETVPGKTEEAPSEPVLEVEEIFTPISTAAAIESDSVIPCNVCTVCPPGICVCVDTKSLPISVQPKDITKPETQVSDVTKPTITEFAKRSSGAPCLSCQVCTGTCDCVDDEVTDATPWLKALNPSMKSVTSDELGGKSKPSKPTAVPIHIEGASTEAAIPKELTLETISSEVPAQQESPPAPDLPPEDVVEAPIGTIPTETASVCTGGMQCWFGCTCRPQEQGAAEPSEMAEDVTAKVPGVIAASAVAESPKPQIMEEPAPPSEGEKAALPTEEEEDIWPVFKDAVCSIELDEDLEQSPMTYGYRKHGMLVDIMNVTPEQIGIPVPPLPEETEDLWPKFIDAVCSIELDEDLEQSPMTYGYRLHADVSNITPEQVGIPVPPPIDKEPSSPEEDIWSKFIKNESEKPLIESEIEKKDQPIETAESPSTEETFDDIWSKFIDNICGQELEEDLAISPMTYGIKPPFFVDVPSASKLESEAHEALGTSEEEKVVKAPAPTADTEIPCTLCTVCSLNTCNCDHPKISASAPVTGTEIPCTICKPCSTNNCICGHPKISAPAPATEIPCTLCRVCAINTCICDRPKISDTAHGESTEPPKKTGVPETITAVYDDVFEEDLESAFITMKQKCRTKDQIITALANELRLRSQSGRFEGLFNKLSKEETMTPEPRDFDRDQLCQYLRKHNGYPAGPLTSHPEPLSARGMEQGIMCGSPVCPPVREDVYRNVLQSPLGLQILKRIGPDGLMLGWNVPTGACFTGYDIFVNGTLKHKIRSYSRNKAMLVNLDLNKENIITMYALTPLGRSAEPACVVYPEPDTDIEISLRTTSCHCQTVT